MPQIWMTYEEVGALLGSSREAARAHVTTEGWDRRRSHDGETRVKLTPEAGAAYLDQLVAARLSAAALASLPLQRLQARLEEGLGASAQSAGPDVRTLFAGRRAAG
jgi:hypothetical protein